MAKAELGDKQICPSCGAKFYDLRKRPAMCPKCGSSFDPAEEGVKIKRSRGRVSTYDPSYDDDEEGAEKAKKAAAGAEDEEEEEVEETPPLDVAADDPVALEDDDEAEPAEGDLPPGFSEEEADLEDDAADDSVPLIEDDEEFPEDEIGELPAEDDEEGGPR